jgi:sterol desaturase/sphingolipid hydroxylase (fatty acid hydroxylase superfamily)
MDVTNPLIYALPFFVFFIGLEIILSLKHNKQLYYWNDFFASLSMGLGASVLAVFVKAASLGAFYFLFEAFKPLREAYLGYATLGWAWYIWVLCQFLDDHNYYWYHRLSHTVRLFWAAHIVHHSSENFNLGSGIRNGWFTLFYKDFFWLWMPIIGFEPIMVATCLGIQAVYQFHLHTQAITNMGFLEKFMNTPRQHQVHHACNYEYLDKNHGGFLNIFDRMYGTYLDLSKEVNIKYGVLHPPKSYNPLVIATHEFRDIVKDVKKVNTWKHKLMYVFGPPGWSHDGSSKTVRQMREEEAMQKAMQLQPQPIH